METAVEDPSDSPRKSLKTLKGAKRNAVKLTRNCSYVGFSSVDTFLDHKVSPQVTSSAPVDTSSTRSAAFPSHIQTLLSTSPKSE
ncbi:hypothetical protein PoB_002259600 [Plakobranchus ocellatus]|uniref:Uncharacterized protein n=1 Tax=Plakobranchus ocellatus TaxID=259542 RepID=A0AAV3ZJG2_9GAST|nr:hypothetical protein PoB_002259600 [Plakobranchus ocellatus]